MTKPSLHAVPPEHIFQTCVIAALVGFGMYFDHIASIRPTPDSTVAVKAELAGDQASPEVQRLAQWAIGSRDHAGLPFVVVDAARSRLFAFDPQGRFLGSTTVLLDASRGEHPNAAPLAGRFVAEGWLEAADGGIVCIEQGAFGGSLRVPGEFYREYLSPLLTQTTIGYVLPGLIFPLHEGFRLQDLQTWLGAGLAQSPRESTRKPS